MNMKPGLSGEVYLSCIILCRDEKPTEYHIGNFPPGSITKKPPTNKQKSHPHKETHQNQKNTDFPPPQKTNQNQ